MIDMAADDAPAPVRVGIVDSGHREEHSALVLASAAFVLDDGRPKRVTARHDRMGHGSAMLDIIHWRAPTARFVCAQVFTERLVTTAAQVAAAVSWLVAQQVGVINLSLGLRQDRSVLAQACRQALAAGVILCAASPARGEPVYPAAYPGMLRMTGDARCRRGELSHLDTVHADFGAHVRPLDAASPGTGASSGCAHLCGEIACILDEHRRHTVEGVRRTLIARARYHGPERRGGTP